MEGRRRLLAVRVGTAVSFAGVRAAQPKRVARRMRDKWVAVTAAVSVSVVTCVLVAWLRGEPVPRATDEFAYLLAADTFASGRLTNPSPPLPEFFESPHVLIRPTYAAKYMPGQGLFLALGQQLTGHPIAGVWLTAGFACAAIFWALLAWASRFFAAFGAVLFYLQAVLYSYWSQSYWGGMVSALGGALAIGAIARSERLSIGRVDGVWLGLGVVLVLSSRPLEGILVVGLAAIWSIRGARSVTLSSALMHAFIIGSLGVLCLGIYSWRVTGSPLESPYALHEQQYQEAPPFAFMSMRPSIKYSTDELARYYRQIEVEPYRAMQSLGGVARAMIAGLSLWSSFWGGVVTLLPVILLGLTDSWSTRWLQVLVLGAWSCLGAFGPSGAPLAVLWLFAIVLQGVVCYRICTRRWPRVAVVLLGVVLCEAGVTKWYFPHYAAAASVLVIAVQVEAYRRLWLGRWWGRERVGRWIAMSSVMMLCLLRAADVFAGARRPDLLSSPLAILPAPGHWSVERARIRTWLDGQPYPSLVFVEYSSAHQPTQEWVYNRARLKDAHVVWARDLGAARNATLRRTLAGRRAWILAVDESPLRLRDYDEELGTAPVIASRAASSLEP